MSANSYLERLAQSGIIRQLEKVNINKSLDILRERVDAHFDRSRSNASGIKDHFVFGSYTRGTMLPRNMDPQSDVDYLVVFDNTDLQPQSCLDRLRRFVEKHYGTSEISQSHPTIILSLNHIRFELVPAIETFFGGIQIASKDSLFSRWMSASPNEFNKVLTNKNKGHDNRIKPLIRLLKYWNAHNNYPFESFALEKSVVGHWTLSTVFGNPNLWERFQDFLSELSGNNVCQTKAIERANRIIAKVSELESDGEIEASLTALYRLLPEVQ